MGGGPGTLHSRYKSTKILQIVLLIFTKIPEMLETWDPKYSKNTNYIMPENNINVSYTQF